LQRHQIPQHLRPRAASSFNCLVWREW
jgi:hypothetical protein